LGQFDNAVQADNQVSFPEIAHPTFAAVRPKSGTVLNIEDRITTGLMTSWRANGVRAA
jgi:hypothetical protein